MSGHLKDHVRGAELTPSKKDSLLKLITEFERELESRRLTFVAVAQLVVTLTAAAGEFADGSGKVYNLLQRIAEAVGNAKQEQILESAGQLPSMLDTKSLIAPRQLITHATVPLSSTRESLAAKFGLDDEIPF